MTQRWQDDDNGVKGLPMLTQPLAQAPALQHDELAHAAQQGEAQRGELQRLDGSWHGSQLVDSLS
jgi:hypothetical protein